MANGGIIGTVNNPTSSTATGVWQQEEQYEAVRDGTWPLRPLFTTKSLRFNRGSSDSLNKTFGTPTNSKKLTISFWTKLIAESGNDHHAFSNGTSNADESLISFINSGSHNLEIKEDVSSSATYQFVTNRIFRDPLAFYHIVIAWDTTQSTESNRLKLYINGVQETSLATANYPNINQDIKFNTAIAQYIGKRNRNEGAFYNGYMAEVIFIDGTQLTPTSFGEFNSDSGIWIPKTITGLTFGNNGFYQKYTNASALGEDFSGEDNDFAVTNITTLDQTSDSPSNNFSTLNPLASLPNTGTSTFTEGNLTSSGATGSYVNGGSTLMMPSGKWYCEMKYISTSNSNRLIVGITQDVAEISRINQDSGALNTFYVSGNGNKNIQGTDSSYGSSFDVGDIVGIALDLDNNKLYFSKNGTFQNSGDPTSGSTGTGAITGFVVPSATLNGGYFFFSGSNSNAQYNNVSFNFGNPSFAISSSNADSSGFGNFEYAVPTGYLSLCTNNLNL